MCHNRMYRGDDRKQWDEHDQKFYPDHSLTLDEIVAMVLDENHPYWK